MTKTFRNYMFKMIIFIVLFLVTNNAKIQTDIDTGNFGESLFLYPKTHVFSNKHFKQYQKNEIKLYKIAI